MNIKRYGWDTAVLDLLGHLYSDRTHFIFELLQNAEDAGATEVTFELFQDRLEVRHDGREFNEDDVRGVCGVGKGTKVDDLTQIGKFASGSSRSTPIPKARASTAAASISGSRVTCGPSPTPR